jgi:DNA repair exonuclease SbcCD ATPase subunit
MLAVECGALTDPENLKRLEDSCDQKILKAKAELEECTKTLKAAQVSLLAEEKALAQLGDANALNTTYRRIMADKEAIQSNLNKLQAVISTKTRLDSQLNTLRGYLETQKIAVNPYRKMAEASQGRITELQKEVASKQGLLIDTQSYVNQLSFWEVGFGNNGVKSFLFDTIANEMNLVIADLLPHVSETITANYKTQKELKSKKGTSEEFALYVNDPEGSWPYESYSGSECQKVKLVTSLALAAVGSGTLTPQIFMDEVTRNLSPCGSKALLNDMLRHLLSSGERGSIYMTTHQSETKAENIDHKITVRMHNRVSTLEFS